ncbi:MAG: DUF1961 family protein [Armatimonadota bacterium]
MPLDYPNLEVLHAEPFTDLAHWHHEGVGSCTLLPGGGMRLHCLGSKQGAEGCMVFFRPDLPDQITVEYDLIVHSHGGLVINYLALRGLQGEDLIEDADQLPPRTGIMRNYYSRDWGLQSFHISFSRFNDEGVHTNTSNWRRNPGLFLVGHGNDPVKELQRRYHIRLTKDAGSLQFYADGEFAHGFIERDTAHFPIPDQGKFGFRLIGSDVIADVFDFRVYRTQAHPEVHKGPSV